MKLPLKNPDIFKKLQTFNWFRKAVLKVFFNLIVILVDKNKISTLFL